MTDVTFTAQGANLQTRAIPVSGIFLLESGTTDQLDNEDGTGDSFELEGALSLTKFDFTLEPSMTELFFEDLGAKISTAGVSIETGILTIEDGFDIDNEDGSGDSILLEGTYTRPTLKIVLPG